MRGQIWLIDLEPVVGHEQGRKRPALIISNDGYNYGPADLVTVLPITSRDKRIELHFRVEPPEGGLGDVSYIMCDQMRTVSKDRLIKRIGSVGCDVMVEVGCLIKVHLDLI